MDWRIIQKKVPKNILVGVINMPDKIYLIKCSILEQTPDKNIIITTLDDILKVLCPNRETF